MKSKKGYFNFNLLLTLVVIVIFVAVLVYFPLGGNTFKWIIFGGGVILLLKFLGGK